MTAGRGGFASALPVAERSGWAKTNPPPRVVALVGALTPKSILGLALSLDCDGVFLPRATEDEMDVTLRHVALPPLPAVKDAIVTLCAQRFAPPALSPSNANMVSASLTWCDASPCLASITSEPMTTRCKAARERRKFQCTGCRLHELVVGRSGQNCTESRWSATEAAKAEC